MHLTEGWHQTDVLRQGQGSDESCVCPFFISIGQFFSQLDLDDDEIMLIDMKGGIEHFARGTCNAVDRILMVVDPTWGSIKLAEKVSGIARSIGKPVYIVLNKVTDRNEQKVRSRISDSDRIIGVIRVDDDIRAAGLEGKEIEAGCSLMDKIASELIA